jgi:Sortilin, neurotensin receptor 3,/Secretion system C-terminal sorting domain
MKQLLLFLFVITIGFSAAAQQNIWEIMERNDLSIREAEDKANALFKITGTGRGTGYKQFQRWLYERKFHVDENGYLISPVTEWNNFLQSRNSMDPLSATAANWTELGPLTWNRTSSWNPGTGRLTAVAIHPSNANVIYVGSPGGGLWKSTNAGTTWAPLTDNNATWMSVFAITIDPIDQNTVYVGTSTGLLLKSTNAGASFTPTGFGPSGTIRKVLINPANTNIVFACATNGIFRSVNAGTSWTQVHTGSKEDIEFKPNDVNIMYATGNDVYRSVDNGVTWTVVGAAQGITNSGRTLVAVTAADPNYVYIVQASGSLFGRMYQSTDAGLGFTTTVVGSPSSGTNYFGYETNGTGTSGQATYDMALDVSPTNANEVYIAGIICWKSVNGGVSFTAITAWSLPNGIGYNHADVHGLFWIGGTLYSISDGGLFKSIDAGDNWTDMSAGLGIRQFYRIANSPTNANVITGGAQDNGTAARQASGNWVDWLGADGMEGLVSPTNHLNLWGTSQNGAIYRSVNGGNSYSNLSQPSSGQWVTPLWIHPTNETILYGGWTGVYKSTNSGTTWTNISGATITSTLADLAVAPSNPNFIYASNGANLYVTTDDGATWATRTAPSTINDITVDPTNPSKIWIACNSTSNRVMVSTDAGATFTNISSNLPSIVARTVVTDDNTPRGIYVGMNIGVYYQQEGASSWTNYSDNLPLVAINELEIQKASGKIRVATYGRGVWESPLADAAAGFTFTNPAPATATCPAPATMSVTLGTSETGGFANPITLAATSGVPAGTTISFGTNPVTPGNTSLVTLNNANTLAAGSYVITITGTSPGAVTQTRNITYNITAGTGPAVTAQPANQTICAGANTSFSITSAAALTLQWQVSTDGGVTYTNISNGAVYSGVTSATLTITGVIAGMNNYNYRCVASTQCGSTNSGAGILSVNTAPAINNQPQDVTLCTGSNNTFSVSAAGTGLTYQWQLSTTGCAGPWNNIATATASTYALNGITAGQNNTAYRCVVSGTCAPAATSNCALLTVVTSVTVTTQPASQTICEGSAVSFNAAGSGTGIIYQWQLSTDGGVTYNNISGANATTYAIAAVTPAMNNYRYRCLLSNATCTTPGTTNPAILAVNTLTAITAQPLNSTVCIGGSASFCVTAAGTNLTYQWESAATCGGTYSNIVGATSSCLNIGAVTGSTNYRCKVTGTCGTTITSSCVALNAIAPVTISTHPASPEVCSGSNVNLTVAGSSTETIIYQWQLSTNGGTTWNTIAGANAATLSLNSVTTASNNYSYRCLLSNASCPTPVSTNAGILTVRQLPTVGLAAAPLTSLLPGKTTTLTATPSASTGGILTYNWFKNTAGLTNAGNTYVVNVENTGSYQVRIQEAFASGLACSSQSPVVVIDAAASNKFFIFPSPNDGQFTVSYYNETGTNTSRTITVFDSKGAKVYNSKFPVAGPYTLLSVNIKSAQRGVYYVVIGDAAGKKLAEGKVLIH